MVGDQRICVAVPHPVLRLEQRHELHVLELARGLQNAEPVFDGMALLRLDRREVGSRALDFLWTRHDGTPAAGRW
jgi:hypothetical protein